MSGHRRREIHRQDQAAVTHPRQRQPGQGPAERVDVDMAFVEGAPQRAMKSAVLRPTRDRRGTGIDRTSVHSPAQRRSGTRTTPSGSVNFRERSPQNALIPHSWQDAFTSAELGDDATAGDQEIRWATAHASPVVREFVRQMPVRSPGRSRLDVFNPTSTQPAADRRGMPPLRPPTERQSPSANGVAGNPLRSRPYNVGCRTLTHQSAPHRGQPTARPPGRSNGVS